MKSSTKILPLTKTIDKGAHVGGRGNAKGSGPVATIRMENEDLLADVRDARSVVDVATEAWTEENEQTASSCVGVLQLIDYKLNLIECALQGINGRDRTLEGRA